jgi:hypothetical protein
VAARGVAVRVDVVRRRKKRKNVSCHDDSKEKNSSHVLCQDLLDLIRFYLFAKARFLSPLQNAKKY